MIGTFGQSRQKRSGRSEACIVILPGAVLSAYINTYRRGDIASLMRHMPHYSYSALPLSDRRIG